jgi:hypothetical protein
LGSIPIALKNLLLWLAPMLANRASVAHFTTQILIGSNGATSPCHHTQEEQIVD